MYYQGFELLFPATEGSKRTVQDGFLATRKYDDGFCSTELNSFGLFFYKQTIARQRGTEWHIDPGEIFDRLHEFLESINLLYKELAYWGPLDFHCTLEYIRDLALAYPPGPSHSIDSEIQFEDLVLGHALADEKIALVSRAIQKIGWGFNRPFTAEDIRKFYGNIIQRTP